MSAYSLIRDNWKGVLVGVAVMAAATYGGPIAGKAVGYLMPKALERVSNTPISDVIAHKSPLGAPPSAIPRSRATLAQVAKDFGITGRLICHTESK